MTRSLRLPLLSALGALALGSAACNCKGTQTGNTFGELGLVWQEADGTQHVDRNATYDFGTAFTGERIRKQLVIRNTGSARLSLTSLEKTDGSEVGLGQSPSDSAPFEVHFVPNSAIDPAGEVTFDMFFVPRGGSGYGAQLLLTVDGTRIEDDTGIITLVAKGEGGTCELPDAIDFGDVPVGEHFTLDWAFDNHASIAGTVTIGDPTGGDATSFDIPAAAPRGDVAIAAMGQVVATYGFAPTEMREYASTVHLKGPGACPAADVPIKGRGVDSVLSWTPSALDFGTVAPGVDARRPVTFTNTSKVPIVLHQVKTLDPSFAWDSGAGDPFTFTVPGGGVATALTVLCRPESLGVHTSTFEFDTGLNKNPHGVVTLTCKGGGPAIKVTPRPELAYGRIAYFANNTTYQAVRKVTIQNVGTRSAPGDTSANLFLGSVAGDGSPGQLPYIALESLNANTDTTNGEVEVNFGSAYQAATGLEATPGKNLMDLVVTIKPKSAGLKEARLTIFSNDPQEPAIAIHISADAQPLPPCNLSVAPTSLNFGLVTPPTFKDLPVAVTNLGQNAGDLCYLSGIDLQAGSDLAFSIIGGPIVEKELQPGETFNVVVRVSPTGAVPANTVSLTGALHFNVSSPTAPEKTVPVTATIGPVCLTITPDVLDFGTVRKGCATEAQEFSIYNTCAGDVILTGFSMQAAAGQPLNGPDCTAGTAGFNPATMRCDEFLFQSTPAVGSGLTVHAGAAPVTFKARYKPIDLGADTGAIAISAIQGGQNVTYLVSLTGNADTSGTQTDTFVQDLKPKADVLIIVDDSCSMQDKQTAMANNFASFIQYANSTNTDWQIGVTTTSMPDCSQFGCLPAPGGKLLGDATNPKVLKPNTPNVTQKFSQKVNVGTNGGTEKGFEPAVAALTPPLVTNENAGFLRYDANLAIVVVSDAGDQSSDTFSSYLNRLRNVKGYNRPNMFTFNDIGPFMSSAPSGCSYDDYTDSASYAQMVMATNGVQYEICAPDWATKLRDLGKTAFGYRTEFYLNHPPSFGAGSMPVEVKINGTLVPATSWTYNATTQAIDFQPNTAPGPGETLTVTYTRACF